MSYTDKQKRIAQRLVKINYLYKTQFLGEPRYKDQFNDNKGFLALRIFLDAYAFERQGAPNGYRNIAKECISERYKNVNKWQIPTQDDAEKIWERFKQKAKEYNLGVNKKLNPLNKVNGIISLMSANTISNIAVKMKNMICNESAKDAFKLITTIKGIGEKIGAFYLRDIADLSIVNGDYKKEKEITDLEYLQPIDTWLKQTFKIIFNYEEKNNKKMQSEIVGLCRAAKVSSLTFNQCAWALGSQLAKNYKDLEMALKDNGHINKLIDKKLSELSNYQKTLNELKKSLV